MRDQARQLWSAAQPRTRTAVQMGALIAVVVIAYSYSLTTLVQLADLNTPLAYVSLVPVVALILAAVYSRPSQPEPSIHDRQTDYIIGLPLMAAAVCINRFLPAKLSAMFWVWRIDLLTLPFFVAGAVAVIFGVRVLWRQKVAVAFLFLAWPYPYTSVLLSVLNAFTSVTLPAIARIVQVVPRGEARRADRTTALHRGARRASLQPERDLGLLRREQRRRLPPGGHRIHRRHPRAAGPQAALARRRDAAAVADQPGPAHPGLLGGPAIGEHFAINVLHPFIGLVTFTLGVGVMILCIRPLGLRIANLDRKHPSALVASGAHPEGQGRHVLPVPKVYLAVSLVLVFAVIVGFCNVGLQSYNLVADVSGSPKVVSFINDPVTPTGWSSRYEATFQWAAPLFGEQSTWNRYMLYPGIGGDLQARTQIVADVIDTPDLQAFAAFGVEQCYQFHGYSLTNVSQIQLAGGVNGQTLAYTSQQFGSWSIVYWILPVKRGANTVYERVVLYVQNQHGVIAESRGAAQVGSGGPRERRPPEPRLPRGLRGAR